MSIKLVTLIFSLTLSAQLHISHSGTASIDNCRYVSETKEYWKVYCSLYVSKPAEYPNGVEKNENLFPTYKRNSELSSALYTLYGRGKRNSGDDLFPKLEKPTV